MESGLTHMESDLVKLVTQVRTSKRHASQEGKEVTKGLRPKVK